MKIARGVCIWFPLALCGVMVLGAMTWLTRGVLASEKERTEAEARADLEERTRLALWRMDAIGAAITTRENGYGPNEYREPGLEMWRTRPAAVRLHFEFFKNSGISSPERGGQSSAEDMSVTGNMNWLKEFLKTKRSSSGEWSLLNEAAEEGEANWQAVPKDAVQEQLYNKNQRSQKSGAEVRKDTSYQENSNVSERAQRAKAIAQNMVPLKEDISQEFTPEETGGKRSSQTADTEAVEAMRREVTTGNLSGVVVPDVSEKPSPPGVTARLAAVGQMRPVWLGDELFLLRQVTWDKFVEQVPDGQRRSVQGVWFNAAELQEILLHEIADLLPQAKLVRVEGKEAASAPLSLVSFPFSLARNESVVPPVTLNPALLVGWIAVLLALLTATWLVHGVMRLSERRASFVSAVTHELRTPLTTFRLYSDMLESGAVKPEKRGDYLRVLSREADRLSHLVENVLSFSKIERGSARSVVRETSVSGLLEPMRERFEARLATAGLTLEMDTGCDLPVRVDAAAVEHILFNLIDNAAKYAASGDPAEVEIAVKPHARMLEVMVSDHGPGIPISERKRIFRAFHKSAREAAESRPGVGLGLALSRRLAKSLGGGLDCVDAKQGACFVLRLPLA
ncbi:MAG: HAMP domain-containing sensor histidine kinase [Verrucomicrobiota bacterium]